MMEPLEAGERVLNGVRNNDLFIFSHPEFRDGMQERFDAFMASVPDEAPPPDRARVEQILAHCPIYPLETAHRKLKRIATWVDLREPNGARSRAISDAPRGAGWRSAESHGAGDRRHSPIP
jgi:hypothetical protein